MLNKKIKRTLCGLVASLCLVGSTVPVFAETVDFDVTVPGDILSPRAAKFDSEQRFYVTGTLFNKTGRFSYMRNQCCKTKTADERQRKSKSRTS